VKERAKIINCYKQTQTTNSTMENEIKTKQNKGNTQTLKQDNKHEN